MHISHSFLDVQMADLVKPVRILLQDFLRVSNIQGKTTFDDKCLLPSKIVSSNAHTKVPEYILYNCSLCPRSFTQQNSLHIHMQVHTQEKLHLILQTQDKQERMEPMSEEPKYVPYTCSLCPRSFTQPNSLKIHMEFHTQEELHLILKTKDQPDRIEARPKEQEYLLYTCSLCPRSFTQQNSLKIHMEIHTQEELHLILKSKDQQDRIEVRPREPEYKLYSCSLCPRSFTQTNSLKIHMQIHTKVKPPPIPQDGEDGEKSEEGVVSSVIVTPLYEQYEQTVRENIKSKPKTEKPCSCSICNKSFSKKEGLKKHIMRHRRKKQFSCNFCLKPFLEKGNLKKHMRVHTVEKPFTCHICNKLFSQSYEVKIHIRTHTGEKPYSCSHCKKSFAHSSSLRKHIRGQGDQKPYPCLLLNKSCFKKPYTCSLCNTSFTQNCSLKTHMRLHTKEKPLKCDMCGQSFAVKSNLTRHMRSHIGEKPFICVICNKLFSRNSGMKNHMRTHTVNPQNTGPENKQKNSTNVDCKPVQPCSQTDMDEKPATCSQCTQILSESDVLKCQMLADDVEQQFTCSLCSRKYSQKPCIKQPVESLNSDKPSSCSRRTRSFSQNLGLKANMQTHRKKKTFRCSLCHKPFFNSSNLTRHMRCHTGERPFNCLLCHRLFTQSNDVKTHMRTHTGEKPFSCSQCKKSFNYSHSLKRHHIRTHNLLNHTLDG